MNIKMKYHQMPDTTRADICTASLQFLGICDQWWTKNKKIVLEIVEKKYYVLMIFFKNVKMKLIEM